MGKTINSSKITKFYFDANIFSHVFIGYQGKNYLALIQRKQETGEIMVNFTIVNLFELLQEWREDKFFDVKEKLQQASKIVVGGNVLEDPSSHVQRRIRKHFRLTNRQPNTEWVNLPWLLSRAKSWSEAEDLVKPIKDYAFRYKKYWLDSVNEMIRRAHLLHNRIIAKGIYKNAEDMYDSLQFFVSFTRSMWKACIKHFNLPYNSGSISAEFAREQFYSFRYWMDFLYNYYRKITVKGTKPRQSDYFDIEQSIYLNIMDYWVSDDPKARRCMKNCRDSSGNPRCISLRTFYNYLTNKIPHPCAPEQASMIRYRTQNQI